MRRLFTLFSIVLATLALPGQTNPQADPPTREWSASWITPPTAPLREPIVLHFRRSLKLGTVPASYVVRVSGTYGESTALADGDELGRLLRDALHVDRLVLDVEHAERLLAPRDVRPHSARARDVLAA